MLLVCGISITVKATPVSGITGATFVCVGGNTFLSDAVSGGTWSSSNIAKATIGSSTGEVTGIAAGSVVITYIVSGDTTTTNFTVDLIPTSISGNTLICGTSFVILSDNAGAGDWSTTNTNVSVNDIGEVTGISPGTATITYSTGCGTVTTTVTVNTLPAAITGTAAICAFTSVTLSDVTSGGTWSSGMPAIATVGSSSGIVTGVETGTAKISYTGTNGCSSTTFVTINTSPSVIHGPSYICTGTYAALSNSVAGGTWTSSNTTVATIDSSLADMIGYVPGTDTITYSISSGCLVTAVISVNQSPAVITGVTSICAGSNTTLSDTSSGGTWSSSTTASATIGSLTGFVTGIGPANLTMYYTLNGCESTFAMTINPLPSFIEGTESVCQGALTTLSDFVAGGGTWSSASTSIATIGSGDGYVIGVSPGTVTITYSLETGCYKTAIVTVNPLPAPISGTDSVCAGFTTDLTDPTTGGHWSSNNTLVGTISSSTGVTTGVTPGTDVITYTLPTGCIATTIITVNAIPGPITGITSVCMGLTTALTDTSADGTWISAGAASVSSSGIVTGVSAGTATVVYVFPTTGCATSKVVIVNPLPAAITGTTSVCAGYTVDLTDATSGGSWSSSNTAIAIVSGTGIVTGITPGTVTITYHLATGCISTITFTVNEIPGSITGVAGMCLGDGTILSDTTAGGVWSSSSTAIATIGSSGDVTSVTAGTTIITYALGSGCIATNVVTVHPVPAAITGATTLCAGATIVMSDVSSGGTWSSSAGDVGSISVSGLVSGILSGTTNISYVFATGCFAVKEITVNPVPYAISGPAIVCVGSTIYLSDSAAGGTWSSASTLIATVGTGNVSGITAGNTRITYSFSTGCNVSVIVNVTSLPTAINGITTICSGSTSSLSDGVTGGVWGTSNSAVAGITASGIVTATGAGPDTATIIYTISTGCVKTTTVSINPLPGAILGVTGICHGATTSLSDLTTGGTWTPNSSAIASVGSASGIVTTGTLVGSETITYTIPTGCKTTTQFTVYPVPAAISGVNNVCEGEFMTLTDATAGGTWSSSNTAVSTVGAGSGLVTGISAGVNIISYMLDAGCFVTTTITVNTFPSTITGVEYACAGHTTALSDISTGGIWTSGSTTIASIGSLTGIVSGLAAGVANITYTMPGACKTTTTVTINPLPAPITGTLNTCIGGTSVLNDATFGGTWSSSNTAGATIDSAGIVTGISSSVDIITYSLTTGCLKIATFEVNPSPSVITGNVDVCIGSTFVLSDSIADGVWSSNATAIATIGASSGLVTGISNGTTTITYKLGTGCYVTTIVTIDPQPAPITGAVAMCVGSSITLGEAGGGSWSSGNIGVASTDISGIVTGVSAGTAIISYTLSTGCFTTAVVTVNAYPSGIDGVTSVCVGGTTTLSDAIAGGAWISSSPGIASIDGVGVGATILGVVSGVSAGSATITYKPATGCFVTTVVVVNPLPSYIMGSASVCVGSTLSLSDTSAGGTWSSSDDYLATIGSVTGIVTGVYTGIPNITYTLPTGCKITSSVTVNPLPGIIFGTFSICSGVIISLSDAATGGYWSSSNTSVAQVGLESGQVQGNAQGTATITYALASGCYKTALFTVKPSPTVITGAVPICAGSILTLTDTTAGGTWSITSGGAIATVGSSSGIVTGITSGIANITYKLPAGCFTTIVVTVNPVPTSIAGTEYVCVGLTTSLSDAVSSGTWTSSNTSVAYIDLTTGVVSGLSAGTTTVTYMLNAGCYKTATITVNPFPAAILGITAVCVGDSSTLTDAVAGGTWSSSYPAIGSIGASTGVTVGRLAGSTTITYTLTGGCKTTTLFIVNPMPSTITGTFNVCVGGDIDLSDAIGGGIWTSTNTAVANIGSISGIVAGVGSGTAVITYSLATGCLKTTEVTVNPVPANITGPDVLCAGLTAALSDVTTGGHWSSSNTAVATIGSSTALLTSLSSGTTIITYKVATGCMANAEVTVNPLPGAIVGSSDACAGTVLFLSDASAGGIWHSSNNAVATIDGAGNVVTILPGKDTINYTFTTGCGVRFILTVNPVPLAVNGVSDVCTGNTITLTDATTGGTWSSGNTAIATVGSGTGIVSGLAAGTVTISYKLIAGCSAIAIVTVNQTPTAISGVTKICMTATSLLSDAIAGGNWTSGDTAVAVVGLISGVTSGVSPGTAAITYTLPAGCMTTTIVTIIPLPAAGVITGPSVVCLTSTILLSDDAGGGIWSSSAPDTASVTVLGEVKGIALGIATISYTVTQFCGTVYATKSVQVNPLPFASIINGNLALCINTITSLSDTITGGTWGSYDTALATVTNSGIVSGITAGTATIIYSVTNSCGTNVASVIVTVDPYAPFDSIYTHPAHSMCAGTEYQNFGVSTVPSPGIAYAWAAYNADIVSQSPTEQNVLISFPTPGAAIVVLTSTVLTTGCTNVDTFTAIIDTSESQIDTVKYYNYTSQLVCTDNTAESYQWGYDNSITLDSTLIRGATFQDYYVASPDFATHSYWVITAHGDCWQKTYYNAPDTGYITGVKQLTVNNVGIKLYPNPADSKINFDVKNANNSGEISVELFDMLGNDLRKTALVAGKGSMNVSDIPSGVYSVMFIQNGIRLGAATFVKN